MKHPARVRAAWYSALALVLGVALALPASSHAARRRAKTSKRARAKSRKARQLRWIRTMKRRCAKRNRRRTRACRTFAKGQKKRLARARYNADRKYCSRRSRRKTSRCKRHARNVRKRRLHWRICGRGYGRARHREPVRSFARRYRVSVASVRAWNRLGRARRLKKGKRYVIRKSPLEGQRLRGGTLLAPESGLLAMQRPHRGWGRPVTVQAIRAAAKAVQTTWPDRDRLIVGDLSKRGGGCLPPHKSHRGGLDADIGYYQQAGKQRSWLTLATPGTIDSERTWLFLKAMLASGRLRYAFIDYGLQAPLYEAARLAGETTLTLAHVFQYPRPRSATRASVFRHLKGHADHMHVRFTCPDTRGCSLPAQVVARIETARLEREQIPTQVHEIAEEDREDGEPVHEDVDHEGDRPLPAVGPTGGVPAAGSP